MLHLQAVKANSEGQEKLRSFHLFKAQQFILYHDLVVNKLAPQAVVDGDHKSLRKWFISLDEGTGWTAPGGRFEEGGAVYLRYLRLLEIVGSLEGDDHQDQEVGDDYGCVIDDDSKNDILNYNITRNVLTPFLTMII